MTRTKNTAKKLNLKEMVGEQEDLLRELVQHIAQQVLEAEMDEAIGAEKGERRPARLGYRSGYYSRSLMTRVGKLELRKQATVDRLDPISCGGECTQRHRAQALVSPAVPAQAQEGGTPATSPAEASMARSA